MEARANEADDKKRRDLIDARNAADSLTYQTEKALRDLGDKVPGSEREQIEKKVGELKEAAQGEDPARIRKLIEEVQHQFHALSQQLYAQDGQPGGPAAGPSAPPPASDGDVIDGEVKDA